LVAVFAFRVSNSPLEEKLVGPSVMPLTHHQNPVVINSLKEVFEVTFIYLTPPSSYSSWAHLFQEVNLVGLLLMLMKLLNLEYIKSTMAIA
jgi:hypothetical protein